MSGAGEGVLRFMCFWIALIVLILALIATPPAYPYSREWGYTPFGGIFILLIILLLLWWFAWLPAWFYPYAAT
jgi:hypothetical protein